MGVQVELHNLVDLALRAPDAGVVNFNHLHTLLHAILKQIDIGKLKIDVNKETENLDPAQSASDSDGGSLQPPTDQDNELRRNLIEKTADLEEKVTQLQKQRPELIERKITDLEEKLLNLSDVPQKETELERKISALEDRLRHLDEFASNQEIIQQIQSQSQGQDVLANIWNYMKLNNRMNAAEQAIDKLTSVVSEFLAGGKSLKDFVDDIVALKNGLKDMQQNVESINSKFTDNNLEEKLRSLDKLQNELSKLQSFEDRLNTMDQLPVSGDIDQAQLARMTNQMNKRMSEMVTKSDLDLYVTWPALEEALNIRKDTGERSTETADGRIHSTDLRRPRSAPVEGSPELVEKTPEPPKTAWAKTPEQVPPEIMEQPVEDEEEEQKEESLPVEDEGEHLSVSPFSDRKHPSPELLECLRQIGELNDKHEKVAVAVDNISEVQGKLTNEVQEVEETLLKKANRDELQFPSDLQQQLTMLKEGLEFLNTNQDLLVIADLKRMALENQEELATLKRELSRLARPQGTPVMPTTPLFDQDTISSINRQLYDLRTDLDRLTELCQDRHNQMTEGQKQIWEDLKKKKEHIDALYNYVERLQEVKADKENVALEMDVKADKEALEGKVSMSTFDQSFNMLDQGLQEALQKIDEYMNEEETLKQTLKQLSSEMEGKLDSEAFASLKDYLENRMKEVQKSRAQLEQQSKMDLTEAAGIRRPLPVHYSCISCNRPVDVSVRDHAEPSLPEADRVLPGKRHPPNPYEMDQMKRTMEKRATEKVVTDLLSSRACGGSHTMMLPHPRRHVKGSLNQILIGVEEKVHRPPPQPEYVREVSIVDFLKGSDGQVYRGRYKVLPGLKKVPSPPEKRLRRHRSRISPKYNSFERLSFERKKTEETGFKDLKTGTDSDDDKQILSLDDQLDTYSTQSTPVTSARKPSEQRNQLGNQFGGSAPDLYSPPPSPAPPRISSDSFRNIVADESKDAMEFKAVQGEDKVQPV